MTEEERQNLFSCDQGRWESYLAQSPNTRGVLIAMEKQLQEKLKAKEEELQIARAQLSTYVRDLPKDLRPLAEWIGLGPQRPAQLDLPSHPLYWNLDHSFTEAKFPDGLIRFLGITGGGKTRRLIETAINEKCIMLTFANDGDSNCGMVAHKIIKRLQSHSWNEGQQKYFWAALLHAFCRFYDASIKEEDSGTARVSYWLQVAKCLGTWIDRIPDPPEAECIQDALKLLRVGDAQAVRLLVDEVQVVPHTLQQEFISVCCSVFDNVVITGTGVSAKMLNAAIDATLAASNAGKADSFLKIEGPKLLDWADVAMYWNAVGKGALVKQVQDVGHRMQRWFSPCRARIAAVAAQHSDNIDQLEAELFRLTEPDHSRGWIRKNEVTRKADHVYNGLTLAYILARGFLGATWYRPKSSTGDLAEEGREFLTSLGLAPMVAVSVQEFAVMECLRKTPVVLNMLPEVMMNFLEDGEAMDASSAGYAFEKVVALAVMKKHGSPAVKVSTLMEILQGGEDDVLQICWPDNFMGPDLVTRWQGVVTVYQCKYRDGLQRGEVEYAVQTTDLEKTYVTKRGSFHPVSCRAMSRRICTASKRVSIKRALVLKDIPLDDVFRTVSCTAAGVDLFIVENDIELKQVRAGDTKNVEEGEGRREGGAAVAGSAAGVSISGAGNSRGGTKRGRAACVKPPEAESVCKKKRATRSLQECNASKSSREGGAAVAGSAAGVSISGAGDSRGGTKRGSAQAPRGGKRVQEGKSDKKPARAQRKRIKSAKGPKGGSNIGNGQ
eukprot:CAMPEP_0196757280 /NCGR_PEP_ID=MMETSP1091-20130531/103584_1 /TAXON_ID=302021 /ORGANISM="Rhodomonas sp., Strain CCMP768" /LENGTH=778 /DNA_ID=CAMNT_0042106051 /DNA_START=94 /DNA_END=2430 /DNA_ORIENTATION=-